MDSKPKKYNNNYKTSVMKNSSKQQGSMNTNFSLMTKLDSSDLQTGPQASQPHLRERDLRLGRATWNKYVIPVHDFSEVLFKELFTTYPDHQSLFMNLIKSKSNKDIFASPNFKYHMKVRVMTKLKDIMEALDKPEELIDIMTKLGLYHVKMGVTRKHMEDMQRTLIMAVRVVMNKTMQSDEEEALSKCFKHAFDIAIAASEDYLDKQREQDKKSVQR